ncbi:MAG TPA: FdtA/QdtA family cupin domain-containing protein [Terriglobales bacterium]|nr:FdtA/QdtA family cupin domain-containing protein [Terriglobales bacterium]
MAKGQLGISALKDGKAGVPTAFDDRKRWAFIEFPKIHDPRGNLTPIEGGKHIPFEIRRVYYLYDVPGGSTRAGHAHRKLHQVFLALSGSFDLHLDDGYRQEKIFLSRPNIGLYVRPGVWRLIENFSSGALCFVLASEPYDEADYIRSPDEFRRYADGTRDKACAPAADGFA